MSSTIVEILTGEIKPKLSRITIANGFDMDVHVIQGLLIHYVSEINNNKSEISFPCVAIQPIIRTSKAQGDYNGGRISWSGRIIGVVSNSSPTTVVDDLESLIVNVVRSLNYQLPDVKSKAMNIEFGDVIYPKPEVADQYLAFEMDISITFIEDWRIDT